MREICITTLVFNEYENENEYSPESSVLQNCSDSLMAETWDDRIVTDSQMADYWAVHLLTETRKGLKMVDQIY